MGQAWCVLNLDKKEKLHAHDFGEGYKFLEFGMGGNVMFALATLLAASESMGAGGGDAECYPEWTGRWAGDRIAIVGDYTDSGPHAGLYADKSFTRIKPEIDYDM